jgi:uncharacterized protein YndB with AHSA1/START domain
MHTVVIDHDFKVPVDRLFAFLSEHENLAIVFAPMRIERLNDGTDGTRNGVGSARRLSMFGALPFVETNTKVVPNELIEYRITEGSPLNHHHGEMQFTSNPDGGSHLHYEIELGSKVPGLAAGVKAALTNSVGRGLNKVDSRA